MRSGKGEGRAIAAEARWANALVLFGTAGVFLVGILCLAIGLLGGNPPLTVVGGVLMALAALGSLSLGLYRGPAGSRLSRGQEGPSYEGGTAMDPLVFRSEHRKRLLPALACVIVVCLLAFLYAWAAYAGTLAPASADLTISTLVVFGVLGTALAYSTTRVLTDGFFRITDQGFWPRRTTLPRLLRGASFVRFAEIRDVRIIRDPSGDAVAVLLNDGTTTLVRVQDGVSAGAMERLWSEVQKHIPESTRRLGTQAER